VIHNLYSFIKNKFINNNTNKPIFLNILWLFFDNIIKIVGGLIIGILVARYFGPSDFGTYNYAISIVSFFMVFSSLGLDNVVIREIINQKELSNEILGSAFVLKYLACLVSFSILISYIAFSDGFIKNVELFVAIVASCMFFQAFDTLSFLFKANLQSKYVVIVTNVAYVFVLFLKLVVVYFGCSLYALSWTVPIESFIVALGFIFSYLHNKFSYKNWIFNKRTAIRLLKDSWPIMLTNLSIMTYMRIDQIMIGSMLGVKEVGIYSAAIKLAELFYFIPNIIVSSFFPDVVNLYKINIDLFYSKLQKLYNLMAFLSYTIIILSTVFARQVINMLFGKDYNDAYLILLILIWSMLWVYLSFVRSIFLNTVNWPKIYFFLAIIGSVTNVALNIVFIPLFGLYGAAWASLISYFFAGFLSCFIYRPLFKNGFMMAKALIKPKFW